MINKSSESLEPVVFGLLLVMLIVPIWSFEYFVTVDGPGHLLNARILYDFWHGMKPFYDPFYYVNLIFDPNRLYYIITTPLFTWCNAREVEKIFFTIYALLFGFGFRYLISSFHPASKFISHVGLLFCFNKLVFTGFINNALSIAVWFWAVGWWWRHRDSDKKSDLIFTAIWFIVLYSAHPVGLVMAVWMVGALMVGLGCYEWQKLGIRASLLQFKHRALRFLLSFLPTLVLLIEYLVRTDFSNDTSSQFWKGTLNTVIHLYALVNLDSAETGLALAVAILCICLFLAAFVLRITNKTLTKEDGLLLFILIVFWCTLFTPKSIAGGLALNTRLVMVPIMSLLFWAASGRFPKWSQVAVMVVSLGIGAGFLMARYPIQRKAAAYVNEIMTVNTFVRDSSTILVLNYDFDGKTMTSEKLSDQLPLMMHSDCYLGSVKPLIISDNYETHFPYFPITVRWNTNMYAQTDKDNINFDHRPPRADMLSYFRRTGQQLDYVLMLFYRDEFRDHPYTVEIFDQLNQGYTKTFVSQNGIGILYQRKDLE